ncbi:MAG TPA: CHAD domain-containing protein [Phycicoccus sp.]|nr:CHAD domain-containing protein [Phycicoccus sp.]
MTARKARRVSLAPDATTSEAFLSITAECTEHWRANVAGVREDRDVESLHQLRVGVRRFRSALSLFARPLDDPQLRWLNDELRECALPFGAGRDLDVFLAGSHTAGLSDAELARLSDRREQAYDTIARILDSTQWQDAWLLVDRFRAAAPWGLDPDPPAVETATDILERRWRRVVKRGSTLRTLTPTERHRVRIQAKKLRYGAQFFADLFPMGPQAVGTPPLQFATGIGELQDALGQLNDTYTDGHFLTSLGRSVPAVDEVVLLEQSIDAHAHVLRLEPFWRTPVDRSR